MHFEKDRLYHLYNQGNNRQKLFFKRDNYLFFQQKIKTHILPFADVVAWCLMPNHFHLLLKQTKNAGIENFLQRVAGSCSHYFNTKYKRKGPLFEGRFQAIRIESDEQLLHLSRYIHLNPYSGYVVKTLRQLEDYPYSSFPEYIEKKEVEVCNKDIILEEFDTPKSYKKFVFDQADYQRSLERIKHQTLE